MYMQLRGWYSKDDVVAEWKKLDGQLALLVHCYVSGPNLVLDLAAEFRYHIFSKEMPLVSVLVCDSMYFRINLWAVAYTSTPHHLCSHVQNFDLMQARYLKLCCMEIRHFSQSILS